MVDMKQTCVHNFANWLWMMMRRMMMSFMMSLFVGMTRVSLELQINENCETLDLCVHRNF